MTTRKKPKPTTGQSAPYRSLVWGDMHPHEQRVVAHLVTAHNDSTIRDLAKGLFPRDERPDLRVRNALRRLVAGNWVLRIERATYRITSSGRRCFQKLDNPVIKRWRAA